jgi:hypothetical protein
MSSADAITSRTDWWSTRRLRYNVGLVVAGILAFIAYVAVGSALSSYVKFEITLFTICFQGIGYLIMIGLANVCYFLGPFSERIVRPSDPLRYRAICYRLGFWFSVFLPFSVPVLLAMSALLHL